MAATAQSVAPHKGSILRASAQGVSSPREFQTSCVFFPIPLTYSQPGLTVN